MIPELTFYNSEIKEMAQVLAELTRQGVRFSVSRDGSGLFIVALTGGSSKVEILETKSWPDLGLQMELLISPAGVPTIRWSDPETDRGFGLVQYSTLEMAEARFAAEVAKAEKNLQPQPTTNQKEIQ